MKLAKLKQGLWLFSMAALSVAVWPGRAQLVVGTGKVEITPDANRLPAPYTSINDPIYTRAILVENGRSSALLMNGDLITIPQSFFDKVAGEIAQRDGIPSANILISATHDHSAPFLAGDPLQAGGAGPSAATLAFTDKVEKAMLEAVEKAKASLQPAEMGYGEGSLSLNVNRDAIDPMTRLWAQEPNVEYPSDKTLAVVEFRRPGGEPIAIYMNYAVHAVSMFLRNQVSGDFPEVAASHVENAYGNGAIAVWSAGAAGDQNPIYLRLIQEITAPRVRNEMDPAKPDDAGGSERGAAVGRLMFGNAMRPTLPLDPKLAAESWQIVQAMGKIMAEQAMVVAERIPHFTNAAPIEGAAKVVTCPGRNRVDHAREGVPGRYEDGPPVNIGIGALRVGDVAFGRANAELYNKIGWEVKEESPFRHTIMVTLADGWANSGYIPSDDAFARYTFQVVSSRLKPGCAERGIVVGVDDLLYQDIDGPGHK